MVARIYLVPYVSMGRVLDRTNKMQNPGGTNPSGAVSYVGREQSIDVVV